MKILIIEDEYSLADAIAETLKKENFTTNIITDGENEALTNVYDLILLDIMLPNKDGFKILNDLRKEKVDTPIIILTAKSEINDKLNGLENGADDYITKPFYTKELLSRISANLRRSKFNAGYIYKKGDIVVDFDRYKISRQGDELNISTNEFDIVKMLIENKGRVVRRDAIYEKIWDIHGNFVEYNTLTVAMSRIKAKLGTYGEKHQQYIETIRNVGYRWID